MSFCVYPLRTIFDTKDRILRSFLRSYFRNDKRLITEILKREGIRIYIYFTLFFG